jgi:hypothetical protein
MRSTARTDGSDRFLSTLTRRPVVRLVALATILIQIGCYVNERRPLPTPIQITDPMGVHWNDQWTMLVDTRLEDDSVLVGKRGLSVGTVYEPVDTVKLRMPVTELEAIDRRFSGKRTGLLILGIVGGLGLVIANAMANFDPLGGGTWGANQ